MTNEEWAYMAGIVDGEGYIGMQNTNNGPIVRFTISNTSYKLMDWLEERFPNVPIYSGGSTFDWTALGRKALPVLHGILPYLIVKRKQAEMAIEFLETCSLGQGRRPPPESIIRREEILESFKTINRRSI